MRITTRITTCTNTRTNRGLRGLISIPSSQRYYWSRRWQADEAASAVEIAAGEVRTFTGPDRTRQAIAWLYGDD